MLTSPRRAASTRIFIIALTVFVLVHLVMFRVVVTHLPQILAGREVVTREELIPIFDFKTQYLDQIMNPYSELTRSAEIRVGYDFLTTWVRHYQILPFALVLLNALSAWLFCGALFILLRWIFRNRPTGSLLLVAASTSFALHSLLLYFKIIHFYTLVVGFSFFSMHLSLLLTALFADRVKRTRRLVTAGVIGLANPSVHYQVLSLLVWLVLLGTYVLLRAPSEGGKRVLKTAGLTFAILLGITTLPYWIYTQLHLLRKVDSLAEIIPVGYHTIAASSMSICQVMALASGSQIQMFKHGKYIPSNAWPELIAYTLFAIAFLIIFTGRKRNRQISLTGEGGAIIIILGVLLIVSYWMSIGYTEPFSFHSLLAALARQLHRSDSSAARIALRGLYLIFQVLRFPHRFQMLTYFALGGVISLGIAWCLGLCEALLRGKSARLAARVLLPLLPLVPLFANGELRATLWSGDFDGFLTPFAISEELEMIREQLLQVSHDCRVLFLPSINGGLYVRDAKGAAHWLHDKFFIYFFNIPSILYSQGDPENLALGFLLYNAFETEEGSWVSILRRHNIRYVVFIADTIPRQRGVVYMPGVEHRMLKALLHSEDVKLIYDGLQYKLFEVAPCVQDSEPWALISTDWRTYLTTILNDASLYCRYEIYHPFELQRTLRPLMAEAEVGKRGVILPFVTSKSQLDMEVLTSATAILWLPRLDILPFTTAVVHLSRYWTPMFSMFTLLDPRSPWNSFGTSVPGPFDTLSGATTSVGPNANIVVQLSVKEKGRYELYVRGLFPEAAFLYSERADKRFYVYVESAGSYVNVEYSYLRVGSYYLEPGWYTIRIENRGRIPVVAEGVVCRGPLK